MEIRQDVGWFGVFRAGWFPNKTLQIGPALVWLAPISFIQALFLYEVLSHTTLFSER